MLTLKPRMIFSRLTADAQATGFSRYVVDFKYFEYFPIHLSVLCNFVFHTWFDKLTMNGIFM